MNPNEPVVSGNFALRLTGVLLIAFGLAFYLYYGINTISDPVFSIDFSPYYVAGQLLAEGRTPELIPQPADGFFTTSSKPYLEAFQKYFFPDSQVATGWIYPAAYAWLFRPFVGMDFITASRSWLLVNMLLSCASIGLVLYAKPWKGNPQFRFWRNAFIVFIGLTFQPILDNLWHGNISALILFFFCLSYLLLKRGQYIWAGFVLGLIVPLKLTPALFILYFIWRKNWKFTLGAVAGSFVVVALTWMTAGFNGLVGYAAMILEQLKAGGVAAFNNQSIAGFLLHVLTKGDVNGWENVSVPLSVTIIRYILVFGMVGFTVWIMRKRPENFGEKETAEDLDLSLLICVMLLASPITWYHYYVWLLVPLVVVFDRFLTTTPAQRHLVLFAVAYGLLVTQGFSQIRSFDPQSIQNVWLLRMLLSSSFFGAMLFFGLVADQRNKLIK
jgi:hypothetical protein